MTTPPDRSRADLPSRVRKLENRIQDAERQIGALRRDCEDLARALEAPPTRSAEKPVESAERKRDVAPATPSPAQPAPSDVDLWRKIAPPPVGPPPRSKRAAVEPRHPEKNTSVTPPAAPPVEKREPHENLEARIGADWLLRAGLVALIIGFALLARYVHPLLQPWHKVAVCYLAAGVMVALGATLESRLRRFARPVAAGGLSLAFFTSFAAHFIELMRCVPLGASLVLMTLSVGALAAAAERWRSQPTAGLAILLGHVAAYVSAGQNEMLSLVAVAFLSLAAIALHLRHDWTPLGILAVGAAYFSHLLWAMREHVVTTPETLFWLNFGFFTSYFVIFFAADLIHRYRLWRGRAALATVHQRLAARVLGPASLALYVTFAVAAFRSTEVYWERIHLFLIPLAAAQTLVFLFQRRTGNRDAPFYGVIAAMLATLGLLSWLGGLTLNLALAAEALLLLLLSRRMDLRFLSPLAEAVLVVNFIHYWQSDAHLPGSWPSFLGGVAVGAVYLVKSRLEETWRPWTGQEALPLVGWISRLSDRLARPLAHVHAIAAAILLGYHCVGFFAVPDDAAGVAVLTLLVGAGALALRSPGWVVTAWALQVWCLFIVLGHPLRTMFEDLMFWKPGSQGFAARLWTVDSLAATVLALGAWVTVIVGRARHRMWPVVVGTGGLVLSIPLAMAAARVGQAQASLVPLWALIPLVLWIEGESWGRPFRRDRLAPGDGEAGVLEKTILAWIPGLRWSFVLAGAFLFPWVTWAVAPRGELAVWRLILLAGASLVAVVWRDSPRLLVGLLVHLCVTVALQIAVLSGTVTPHHAPWLTWILFSVIAGAACVLGLRGRSAKRVSFYWGGFGAIAIGIVSLYCVLLSRVSLPNALLWVLPCAALWVAIEVFRLGGTTTGPDEAWRDRVGLDLLRSASKSFAVLASTILAVLLVWLTHRHVGLSPEIVCVAALLYAALFLVTAGLLRSPALAGAYAAALTAGYAIFALDIGLSQGATRHPFVMGLLALSGLLSGGIIERLGNRAGVAVEARRSRWACVGAWHAYLPAVVFAGWLAGGQGRILLGSAEWSLPVQMAAAALVVGVAAAARLGWMQTASGALAGWVVIRILVHPLSPGHRGSDFLMAGLLAVLQLIVIERILAWQDPTILERIEKDLGRGLRTVTVVACAVCLVLVLAVAPGVKGSWTTLGWSLAAFVLMALGFLWKARTYRLTALGIFALSLVRVVVVDVAALELFYRMLAFLCLGVCLVAVSLLYSRHRQQIHRWL